jgi:DeoR family transcriptional regulator, aga operon transcriptional repressor
MADATQPSSLTPAAVDPAQEGRGDKQENRLTSILALLQRSGSVTVEELRAALNVSVVTIRRDLNILEDRGLLRRTHGGAESIEPLFYEAFRYDRSFQVQVARFADEKRRIGRAAATLIQPGETIALTPGTTTTEVIRGLPLNGNITVVTNTINIPMELSKRKDINVFVTGGHLRGEWFSLVGPTAISALGHVVINTLFIGADGMDATWGATCFSPDEAALNSTLVRHARRKVAVVDHSKFSTAAGWRICESAEIDILITDTGATDEMVKPFEELGMRVMRV